MSLNRKKVLLWVFYIAYLVVILLMSFHHENWRDEAQAFLLCRDMNFIELLKNVHYEGHPFFYYLLLYPFVKIGVGPKIVNIFSFVFMACVVYTVLFRSKLNTLQKISIILSYPVLYEFSVIGRSYSLLSLLLVWYAILYPDREKHPILLAFILGLLMNTHILMCGFVGIQTLLFYVYELYLGFRQKKLKKKKGIMIGFLIVCLFGILLLIQFSPLFFIHDGMKLNSQFSILSVVSMFIFILSLLSCYGNIWISSLTLLFLIMGFIKFYKVDRCIFVSFLFSLLFMSALIIYVFTAVSIYMIALALVIFYIHIIMMSQKIEKDRGITILLILLFAFSLFFTIRSCLYDLKYPYSNSLETAKFMKNHVDENAVVVCSASYACSSLVPYVENSFYHANTEEFFTYIVWKKNIDQEPDYSKLSLFIERQEKVYYIYVGNEKIDKKILDYLKSQYEMKKVYASSQLIYIGENYVIYEIMK